MHLLSLFFLFSRFDKHKAEPYGCSLSLVLAAFLKNKKKTHTPPKRGAGRHVVDFNRFIQSIQLIIAKSH